VLKSLMPARLRAPGPWKPFHLLVPTAVDGEMLEGPVMRRREGGRMAYRKMTDEELQEALWAQANR
jgi:hypothetical protein